MQINKLYPLSPLQEGFLFHAVDNPCSDQYIIQLKWVYEDELDEKVLKKSWSMLVERHDVLRTGFNWNKAKRPLQYVVDGVDLPWYYYDLSRLNRAECLERIESIRLEDRYKMYNLQKPGLFRLCLIKESNSKYTFIFSCHHIILDGWSLAILLDRLHSYYADLVKNKKTSISYNNQYEKYIKWLENIDKSASYKYWQNQMALCIEPTQIRIGQKPVVDTEYTELVNQADCVLKLDSEETKKLTNFAKDKSVTLGSLLQLVHSKLLQIFSGEDTVIYGAVVSGRTDSVHNVETMTGMFINTLPIVVDWSSSNSMLEQLEIIHKKIQKANLYSNVSLSNIKKNSDLRETDLFDSIFMFENYPTTTSNNALNFDYNNVVDYEKTNYSLTVSCIVKNGELIIKTLYNKNVFTTDYIERYLKQFKQVLFEVIKNPNVVANKLNLLAPAEAEKVYGWGVSEYRQYPSDKTIIELFEEQVEKYPKNIAVAYENETITYEELDIRADRLSFLIRDRYRKVARESIASGALIGVSADRNINMIVAILAILKSGAAYLPLDGNYPDERLKYMISDANLKLIITESSVVKYKSKLFTNVGIREKVLILDQLKTTNIRYNKSDVKKIHADKATDPAYVIYTSGSTGSPKGVCVSQKSVVSLVRNTNFITISPGDTIAQIANASFDAMTFEMWGALLNGAKLAIVNADDILIPERFDRIVDRHSINIAFITTALFNVLAKSCPKTLLKLHALLFGGEKVNVPIVRDFLRQKKNKLTLLHMYGPTECTTYSSYCELGKKFIDRDTIPIGKPLSREKLYVLDKNLCLLPPGVIGELYVGGEGLAIEYLNNEELTKEKFIKNPFEDCEMMYRAGDTAYWLPDGNLEFVGRMDKQVKIRGFRIEIGEIESVLSNHSAIQQTAVLVRQDGIDKKLVAYYIVDNSKNEQISVDILRDYLGKQLPDYMIPHYFIEMSDFPMTANGKIDKKALEKIKMEEVSKKKEFTQPVSKDEKALAKIWQEVLKVDRVGLNDNFYALGGDSIMSIQVVARARDLGINFTPRQLSSYATIAELVNIAKQASNKTIDNIYQGLSSGSVSLTPIQRYFFECNFTEYNYLNQAYLLDLPDYTSFSKISNIINKLVEHHDALRLRYRYVGNNWKQEYVGVSEQKVIVEEINLPETNQLQFIEQNNIESQEQLDIKDGPLLRINLYTDPRTGKQKLFIVVHHLVVDGVSWRIFLEDFWKLYQDEDAVLPLKSSSYQEWSNALSKYAQSDELDMEWGYWLKVGDKATDLPVNNIQEEFLCKDLLEYEIEFTEYYTSLLLNKVSQAYQTQVNDILLTSLVLAYHSWSGNDDLLLHLEGHGREECISNIDISRTIGWFTSLFPVHLHLPLDRKISSVIKSIKEQLREIPNKGVGYGILKYLSNDARKDKLIANDKAQICFNYLGQMDEGFESNTGPVISPRNQGMHLIDINGSISNGRLKIQISYSRKHFSFYSIEMLANSLCKKLKEIIKHCSQLKTQEYTPSDFPLAPQLNQEFIDSQKDLQNIYSLSPVQEGMLFHHIYGAKNNDQYCTQIIWDYKGYLNEDRLKKCWNKLILSHDILRTKFVWENISAPAQVVERNVELLWRKLDWSKYPAKTQKHELSKLLRKDRKAGFDLGRSGLMRLYLIKLDGNKYSFIFSHHHIMMDGWSFSVIFKAIHEMYEEQGDIQVTASEISDKKLESDTTVRGSQYINYIRWLKNSNKKDAEKFWCSAMKNFKSPNVLPISQNKLDIHHVIGNLKTRTRLCGLKLTELCKRFAIENEITLNVLFELTWGVVLSKYSGEKDVVFGTIHSGRAGNISGIENIAGLFINTLPRRIMFQENKSIIELLVSQKEQAAHADKYTCLSLNQIQSLSMVSKELPLFYTLFVFENYPAEFNLSLTKSKLHVSNVNTYEKTNYPLTLSVTPVVDDIQIELAFDADCFNGQHITNLIKHFINTLSWVVCNPNSLFNDINFLSKREENSCLHYNYNIVNESNSTVLDLFRKQVLKTPNNIAVIWNTEELSFKELDNKSDIVAGRLYEVMNKRSEVKGEANNCVGLYLERSVETVIAMLAVMKVGATYVPIDPEYPENRTKFIIEDARIKLILTNLSSKKKISPLAKKFQLLCIDKILCEHSARSSSIKFVSCKDSDPAYIIYTSGSTGQPKGVVISHKSLFNHMQWVVSRYNINSNDRMLQRTSYCFDASVWEFYAPLLAGGTLVMAPLDVNYFPERLIDSIIKYKITLLQLVPVLLSNLILENELKRCVSLRNVYIGGDALKVTDVEALFDKLPKVKVINLYGPTEATIDASYFDCIKGSDLKKSLTIPIGKAITNTKLYVLDKDLKPVPCGVPGELYIGGEGLAIEYLNRPELTKEKFIDNPYVTKVEKNSSKNIRLYKTGDIVSRLQDGNLIFIGRDDEQVKINGQRIETGEIEAILSKNEEVKQCAVLVKNVASTKQIVAYLTVNSDKESQLLIGDLKDFLANWLPKYMIPHHFFILEEMPLTSSGKVNKIELINLDLPSLKTQKDHITVVTALQKNIISIWEKVLRLDNIGIEDNFFSLGGDSIKSIQIISRARNIGIVFTPKQLFDYPTIAELSQVLETSSSIVRDNEATDIVPGEDFELTPIQLWFFEQGFSQPNYFNQAFICELSKDICLSELRSIFSKLIDHHDSLRLRFIKSNKDNNWRQFYASNVLKESVRILEIDLSDESNFLGKISEITVEQQNLLSIENGPIMVVVKIVGCADHKDRLFIAIHHLAVDGVSWRVLLEDFDVLYQRLTSGERLSLGNKTSSYMSWQQALMCYAGDKGLQRDWDYWLKVGAARDFISLTTNCNEAREHVSSSFSIEFSKPYTLSFLRNTSQAFNTRINDILLSALALSYQELTGSRNILLKLEGHGREECISNVDVSRTVGWFTSLYPMELNLPVDAQDDLIANCIKSIKEQLRSIPDNGLSYGVLRYLSSDSRRDDLIKNDKSEIIFNYLGEMDQDSGNVVNLDWESAVQMSSSDNVEQPNIAINGAIVNKILKFDFSYPNDYFARETVEKFALLFEAKLKEIIDYCCSYRRTSYTPSDFPLANLNQGFLDNIGADVKMIYGLTPLQKGMLFHALLTPTSDQYHTQIKLELGSQLDPAAFKKAWMCLVGKYAVFRTSFAWENLPEPVQLVHGNHKVVWLDVDLRGSTKELANAEIQKIIAEDRLKRFDLTDSELSRFYLIRLFDGYVFVWSHHHILFDGWCLSILLDELERFYLAEIKEELYQSRNAPQYIEYVKWLLNQNGNEAKLFWADYLSEFSSETNIHINNRSLDIHKPIKKTGIFADYCSSKLQENCNNFIKNHGVTLNTLIQMAWGIVLSKYSGDDSVVYGTIVSGRNNDIHNVENIVGLLINTLPIRINVNSEKSVLEYLYKVQSEIQQCSKYGYLALNEIQESAQFRESSTLFYTLLVFENYPDLISNDNKLGIREIQSDEKTNYPITITVLPEKQTKFEISYDLDCFHGDAIKRLMAHLMNALTWIVNNETNSLSEADILTADEKNRLLPGLCSTNFSSVSNDSIQNLFQYQVEKNNDRAALEFGEEQLTYSEVNIKANQLANYLRKKYKDSKGKELEAGSLIGVCLKRSLNMVIALLAVVKAGCGYVPLDPKAPSYRNKYIIKDSRIDYILTTKQLLDDDEFSYLAQPGLLPVYVDNLHEIQQESVSNLLVNNKSKDTAYVIYTSGTTGKPKGVMISHYNVIRLLRSSNDHFDFSENDIWTMFHSYNFDFSVWEMWGALLYGGKLIIPSEEEAKDIDRFYALVSRKGVTVLNQTPSAFKYFITADQNHRPSNLKLRYIIFGGEKLSFDQLAPWYREHDENSPMLVNMYGITETTVHVTYKKICKKDLDSSVSNIGEPLSDLEIFILDKRLCLVPTGIPGEIYVGGAGLAKGYLNNKELTSEKFVQINLYGNVKRLYRTGDLACWLENGDIKYLGRLDRQVKIRGFRIALGELEEELNEYKGINQSIVVERYINDDKYLVAYYMKKSNAKIICDKDVRNFLSKRLPYYMIPSFFVKIDDLPITINGKIDVDSLPDPVVSSDIKVKPQNEIEEKLVTIWGEVLRLDKISTRDDFFSLGGHSLLALSIAAKIQEVFKIRLSIADIFNNSTLIEMAQKIGNISSGRELAEDSLDHSCILVEEF